MKNKILQALAKPFCHSITDINKATNISKNTIDNLLGELISENLVHKINKQYYLKKQGTIQIKDKGFGFIKVDNEEKDYYVYKTNISNSFSGDLVEFIVLPSLKGDNLDSAKVINVIKRYKTHIVGRLAIKKNKKGTFYFVSSHDKDFDCKCYIEEKDLNNATDGDIVSAKITNYRALKVLDGIIEKIIGHKDDPGIDIATIAEKYGFVSTFNEDVVNQTKEIPSFVDQTLYPNRKDYTNELIITIDGDDSKDFDDAVSVKILPNGNYHLGVFIADVSEYVTLDSPLDIEALKRGTSVYLADRVIPMLPRELSNGICSLNEGVLRLVLACEMEFDPKGKLVDYQFNEGIIKSSHRMTYSNVNKILKGDEELIKQYQDVYPMLLNMYKLSKIIRSIRTKKGAIEFEVPEYKVVLDDLGNPIEFVLRCQDDAEMLIEDFMLSANETVAYHLSISNLLCAYRIHEEPDYDNISKVYSLINNLGYKAILPRNKIMPKDIQKTMDMVRKSLVFSVVNQLMLRSMAKAKYSPKNLGHYGLAMKYYCHFTSPIRRYPDLFVHRIIKQLVLSNDNFEENLNLLESIIEDVCDQSSKKEREAIECEREVVDMLMASYMENHIGKDYLGTINSITKFGFFVTLDNGVEGLVHKSNINSYFVFDEEKMIVYIGNKQYHIGDKVEIVVLYASKKEQKVDFMLKEDYYEGWRY